MSEKLLIDSQTWDTILEPFAGQPGPAQVLAQALFDLKQALQEGRSEVTLQVIEALSLGLERLYPHTDSYQVARDHFVLSLHGELQKEDEPLNLISAVIERGQRRTS